MGRGFTDTIIVHLVYVFETILITFNLTFLEFSLGRNCQMPLSLCFSIRKLLAFKEIQWIATCRLQTSTVFIFNHLLHLFHTASLSFTGLR